MAFVQDPAPPYSTPLAGGTSVQSQWWNAATGAINLFSVSAFADQPGLLQIQTSSNVNQQTGVSIAQPAVLAQTLTIANVTGTVAAFVSGQPFYRWSYTNSSGTTNVTLSITSFGVQDPALSVLQALLSQSQILNTNFLQYADMMANVAFNGTRTIELVGQDLSPLQ